MDKPNEDDPNRQRMSRAEYSRNVRAAIEERRHQAMGKMQQYQPQIHEQIRRLFAEYRAPLFARIRGFGRARTLALAESTVIGLAAGADRSLSDTETQALTEHFLSSIHNMVAWKWVMTGLAGYMAYRGRQTMRFPFFQPVLSGGRFDPVTGGPNVRIMWHSARFVAYYGAFWVMTEPVFQAANFMRQSSAMNKDPRLTSLMRDGKKQVGQIMQGAQDSSSQHHSEEWASEFQQERPAQPNDSFQTPSQAVAAQRQQAWGQGSRPEPSQQSSSPRWGSTNDMEDDDASPVSSSSRSYEDPSQRYGSAWDRVRQQSQFPPSKSRPQDQKTWEAPRGTDGWGGDEDDGASPQSRSPRNSYTFSIADEEKATAKTQAQKEFDQLLERERRGVDQERGSWVKR